MWRLCDVVTGDESWFYYKEISRKSSNAGWLARGNSSPTIVRHSHISSRPLICIFFKSTGAALIHSAKRGQTIDHHHYISNCLQPVVDDPPDKTELSDHSQSEEFRCSPMSRSDTIQLSEFGGVYLVPRSKSLDYGIPYTGWGKSFATFLISHIARLDKMIKSSFIF